MPIVWKTSFEDPLIKLHTAGKVNLVDNITTFYDACVKQGLPMAPGTPAGPLISGNTVLFKQALNTYFKTTAATTQSKILKVYISQIKATLLQIKDIHVRIKSNTNTLRILSTDINTTRSRITKLQSKKDPASIRESSKLETRLIGIIDKSNQIFNRILRLKQNLISSIRPKIARLKQELFKLTKKLLTPALQATSLVMYKDLPSQIQSLVTEFKGKKVKFIKETNSDIKRIRSKSSDIKRVIQSLNSQDSKEIQRLIKVLLVTGSIVAATAMISLIDKYPNSKISVATKNNTRKAISDIFELKRKIDLRKIKVTEKLKIAFNERKSQLVTRFKPKSTPGPSKIKEAKDDAKLIKSLMSPVRLLVKDIAIMTALVSELKKESAILNNAPNNVRYATNSKLVGMLNKQSPGLGSKYATFTDMSMVKPFIILTITAMSAKLIRKLNLKNKAKNKIKTVKSSLGKKKYNKQAILFNNYLRLALTGYWTAGTMPNLGIVTFPGTTSVPVMMNSTANSANFIRSLSTALQAHSKTITGTYTTSTTPPVVLPWVGYI